MKRTRLAALALTAPLALALAACGGSDDDPDTTATSDDTTSAAPSEPAPSTAATEPSESGSASGSPSDDAPSSSAPATPAQPGDSALLAAATTGQDTVDGTVFSVDRQDAGGWEVSVVTDDGAEYDVRVSADGASAEGRPVEDRDDGDDATRDRDERLRLLDVAVDYRAAVEAASGSGTGEPTGIDLDEENGAITWEVTYGDDTPDEVTVYVDADSGEVVRTERDD